MSEIRLIFMNAESAYERRDELLPLIARCYREKVQDAKNQKIIGQELAAGYLMYAVLGAGADYEPVLSQWGKPLSKGDMPHFNISHSGKWAVLAVSDMPVGVDIQLIGMVRWAAARRLFSTDELSELENADESAQPAIFTRLWTRLEAWLKLTGKGFSEGIKRQNEDEKPFISTLCWDDCIVSCASERYNETVTEELKL